jgi:ABC-type sugar transport system ATPase subunit
VSTEMSSTKTPILSVRGIYKHFGGLVALGGVDFDLYEKEVLALLGDNGAGKSTLCKVIAGAYKADKGEIVFEGNRARIHNTKDSRQLGINMIYQDLALFEVLDVTSNLYMGEEICRLGFLRKKAMDDEARRVLKHMRATVKSLRQEVRVLSGGQRHSTAIGRGLYIGNRAKVIILDEPTAGLSVDASGKVLELMKELKNEISVILITHNLDHVFEVADRAVILRNGLMAGEVKISESNKAEIVGLMVGG